MSFKALFLTAAMASSALAANNLNFIYSRGDFATGGPGGTQTGHTSGLTITDNTGKELYSESYPGNASPCANPNMELKIKSSCWEGEFSFNCAASAFGRINGCEVKAGDNKFPGKVDSDENFTGISVSVQDVCGGGFATGGDCGEGATFEIASHNP
ncbi:hypothetical protein FNYG_12985 [Fusarium nygamai]|uniref:Uncharacterized protein n=1 Tax=Gibberella nygamai TaxID=42673 RepID=A0A2K0VUT9_GIBNY|nr:hypothetical protein FNYG_12985 [Fusarium nygamai]